MAYYMLINTQRVRTVHLQCLCFLSSHCAGDDSRKFFSSLPCGGLGVSINLLLLLKLHELIKTLP